MMKFQRIELQKRIKPVLPEGKYDLIAHGL